MTGHKIKVAGEDSTIRIYFVSTESPEQRVKVIRNLGENSASKVLGIVPVLSAGTWKVKINTQFTGAGSKFLKEPRVITSEAILTVPSAKV